MSSLMSLRNVFLSLAFLLLGMQIVFTVLYSVDIAQADDMVIFLTTIHFAIPILVLIYFMHLRC